MKDHVGFPRAAVVVAHAVPEAHFLLTGREVGPDNPALTGIVPSELLNRFHFLGERDGVPDLMRAMDLFCNSSAWGEAFPNVIGEAMATGLPCIVTDIGDSADIASGTGVVIPARDEEALSSAMVAVCHRPSRERAAMGRGGPGRSGEDRGTLCFAECGGTVRRAP